MYICQKKNNLERRREYDMENSNEFEGRIESLDFIKVVACILVIIIHITASILANHNINNGEWIISKILNNISQCAVPLFIMVTGVVILRKKYNNYKYRILWTLKVIIVWGIIYMIIVICINGDCSWKFISKNIIKIVFNGTYYHTWYLYQLLSLYLLAPFIKKIVNNSNDKEIIQLLSIILIYNGIFPIVENFGGVKIEIDINTFSICSLYLILGYYIANTNKSKINNNIICLLGLLSILILNMICLLDILPNYIINRITSKNSILIIIYSVSAYITISKIGKTIIGKRMSKLVTNTFAIYLIHPIVWDILKRVIPYSIINNDIGILFYIVIISIIIFIVSDTIARFLKKFKIINLILF